ncbi:hypothetical protein BC833DRAFT_612569 [Globomyces pollinis-pini]|nr:hypothetical protein BC833DRAFT_612569 [Globomyces pollinis-pini]
MDSFTPSNFVAPLCLLVVILFGVWALYMYKNALKNDHWQMNSEFFLTAKNTQPWYRVAWGFYACSIGASVMFSVPQYVSDPVYGAGILGLLSYSFFSGFPFLIIANIGMYIKKRFPEVLSIGSYTKWRFGTIFAKWVIFNVLLNVGIALCAEYTAIGELFGNLLQTSAWIPILVVSIVTMVYTAAGGLYVALLTDQIQSIFIFVVLAIVGVYLSINFRVESFPPLPPYLGVNPIGEASVLTLGLSLTSSAMFSDAIWQRVWAAEDDDALIKGASVGSILVMFITFLFGFGGFLASWVGLVTDPNTAFLELLKINGEIPILILLCVGLICSTMNEAAVDSFQIALSDTVISLLECFDIHVTLRTTRFILIFINIPCALIGCLQLKIIGLYLITNLLTTCLMVPLCIGMIPKLDRVVSGASALFGSLFALSCILIYSLLNQLQIENNGIFDFSQLTFQTFLIGIVNTFYVVYSWQPFLIAILGSVTGVFIWYGVELVYYWISGKERFIPNHLFEPVSSVIPVESESSDLPSISLVED